MHRNTNSLVSELDDIGIKFNTDKASLYVNRDGKRTEGHDYLRFYESFFAKYRGEEASLLELGVGPSWNMGASLKTWLSYFPKAWVVGVDVREECLALNDPRLSVLIGNLSDPQSIDGLSGKQFDIIVDDASHKWAHQQLALQYYFPRLKNGGIYVVEDIHTSFPPLGIRYSDGFDVSTYEVLDCLSRNMMYRENYSTNEYIRNYISGMVDKVYSVSFCRGSCVIQRR